MAVVQKQYAELREGQLDDQDPEIVRDHILNTVNPVIRGVTQALNGGINGKQQLDADVLLCTVQVALRDWVLITPTAPFVNTIQPYANLLAVRKDQNGNVWWRGLLNTGVTASGGAGAVICAIPDWAMPQSNSGTEAWRTNVTAAIAGTKAGCQVDADPSVKQLKLFPHTALGANPILTELDIEGIHYPAINADPEPLPGFPLTVIIRKGRIPYRVDVCQALDTATIPRGQTQRQHAIPYSNPSTPGWRYLGESDGQNRIAVDSIAGLSLGRTYNITLQVWYT